MKMIKLYKEHSISHFFSNFQKNDKLSQDFSSIFSEDQILSPVKDFLYFILPTGSKLLPPINDYERVS